MKRARIDVGLSLDMVRLNVSIKIFLENTLEKNSIFGEKMTKCRSS
jgi:hypothetical protein